MEKKDEVLEMRRNPAEQNQRKVPSWWDPASGAVRSSLTRPPGVGRSAGAGGSLGPEDMNMRSLIVEDGFTGRNEPGLAT
jgi:hypothetical protein